MSLETELQARIDELDEQKNGAYAERNQLVAALSKLFPAYKALHPEDDREWEDDWRWIIFIELPSGQVSWHIHDDDLPLFAHLDIGTNNWDGHSTATKYERLARLPVHTLAWSDSDE